jgi:hypothetical protein
MRLFDSYVMIDWHRARDLDARGLLPGNSRSRAGSSPTLRRISSSEPKRDGFSG